MVKSVFPSVRNSPKSSPEVKALTDAVAIMTGQRGQGLDRVITLRELGKLDGFNIRNFGRGFQISFDPDNIDKNYQRPTKPVFVNYYGLFETVLITWGDPDYDNVWYAYTEIYRAQVDGNSPVFSEATLIATSSEEAYTDFVRSGETYRYWIRHVNRAGEAGPTDTVDGTDVTTFETPADAIREFTDKIKEGKNYQWLTTEIARLSALDRVINTLPEDSALARIANQAESIYDLSAEMDIQGAIKSHYDGERFQIQSSKNFARASAGINAALTETETIISRVFAMETRWTNDFATAESGIANLEYAVNNENGSVAGRVNELEASLYYVDPDTGERTGAIASYISEVNTAIVDAETGAIATAIKDQRVEYKGQTVSLQTLTETVANADDIYSAQWGIKSTIGDITRGIGFYHEQAKTDGSENTETVKNEASVVFHVDQFIVTGGVDPDNNAVFPFSIDGDGRTLINTALIDTAFVTNLAAQNALVQNLAATVVIESPITKGGRMSGTSIDIGGQEEVITLPPFQEGQPDRTVTVDVVGTGKFRVNSRGDMWAEGSVLKNLTILDDNGEEVFSSGKLKVDSIDGLKALAKLDKVTLELIDGLGDLASQNSVTADMIEGLEDAIPTFIDLAVINNAVAGQILAAKIRAEEIQGDVYDIIYKQHPANKQIFYSGTKDRGEDGDKHDLIVVNAATERFVRRFTIEPHQVHFYKDSDNTDKKASFRLFVELNGSEIWSGSFYAANHSVMGEVPRLVFDLPANTACEIKIIGQVAPISNTGFNGYVMREDKTDLEPTPIGFACFKKSTALS